MPHEIVEHLVQGDRNPDLAEHVGKYLVAESFAIDQHAIAVKDDQLESRFFHEFANSEYQS